MRQVELEKVRQAVESAVIEANTRLPDDIVWALEAALQKESSPRARRFLSIILENARLADAEKMALCQDTGLV
ncbi:MAG: fumarate hydratase, partial [Syntrophomonas sp.]